MSVMEILMAIVLFIIIAIIVHMIYKSVIPVSSKSLMVSTATSLPKPKPHIPTTTTPPTQFPNNNLLPPPPQTVNNDLVEISTGNNDLLETTTANNDLLEISRPPVDANNDIITETRPIIYDPITNLPINTEDDNEIDSNFMMKNSFYKLHNITVPEDNGNNVTKQDDDTSLNSLKLTAAEEDLFGVQRPRSRKKGVKK